MPEQKQQTLIEKVGREHNEWSLNPDYWMDNNLIDDVFNRVIEIVKQHSDWVLVSEELPVLEYECGFRSFEPTNFYQIIDNEGCLHNAYFSTNHYANDDRALFTLCELSLYNGKWLVEDEYEVITVDMTKYWKPLSLPSEVQEKIYQQEMDKIRFCACGCILADGSTRCSDCGALYDM